MVGLGLSEFIKTRGLLAKRALYLDGSIQTISHISIKGA
jgi:hypothetical protein